jgi:hypothetical protein
MLGIALVGTVIGVGTAVPAAVADGEYEPPPVVELTDDVKEPLISALKKEGLDFADIEIVIVADGQGQLVAMHRDVGLGRPISVPLSGFVVPEDGTGFKSAVVISESSPGKLVACGPPSPRQCTAVP